MKYACINTDGIIENIIESEEAITLPGYQVVAWEEGMDIGKKKVNDVWIWPNKTFLRISIDKTSAAPGNTLVGTAKITDGTGAITNAKDGTYYIPIVREADGIQAKLLAMTITDGQGTVSFSLDSPGIYTLRLDKITPGVESELVTGLPTVIITD